MTLTKLLTVSILLALASCENKQAGQNNIRKPIRPIAEPKASAASTFLQLNSYAYAINVAAIPAAAIRRITALEKDTLKICDGDSGLPINLGDVHAFENECTSKLHFALVGDSACLLSYLKGGIGVHTVVYYLTYKGALRHESYTSGREITTIAQLDSFLQKQINTYREPAPATEDDYNKLNPPPPWPAKAAENN